MDVLKRLEIGCGPKEIADCVNEITRLRKALSEISLGDGTYGSQAFEYKQIARKALEGIGK